MPDSINRLEDRGERLAVIMRTRMEIADYRSANTLTREHEHLYTQPVDEDTVRVGTTTHPNEPQQFEIHGVNGIYYEAEIIERPLTDDEIEWCENTFMYRGDSLPETLIEFEIPHADDLTEAILDGNLNAYPDLKTWNPDHETRHEIMTELQKDLERERLLKTKLSPQKGYPIDVDPEWDPDTKHNETRSQRQLHDMVGMRCDASMRSFETVTGIEYYVFLYSRARSIGVHEPKLEYWDLIALDLLGHEDWSYCRECGGVLPEDNFLHIQRRGREGADPFRICESCAEKDYTNNFSEDAVNQAKDTRAKNVGGQRRLQGYSEDPA